MKSEKNISNTIRHLIAEEMRVTRIGNLVGSGTLLIALVVPLLATEKTWVAGLVGVVGAGIAVSMLARKMMIERSLHSIDRRVAPRRRASDRQPNEHPA